MSFVIQTLERRDSEPGPVLAKTTVLTEVKLLLQLALPTVIIQLGSTVPSFFIASYVGRNYGSVYLDAFTLASLTGNLFTLSLLQGLYTASDTLSPQAYGAGNKRQVGLLAMRGFFASMVTVLPFTLILVVYMQSALEYIGEDPTVSRLAMEWYRIYVVSLPFYALYQVSWKFLSAQNVMVPLVLAVVASCAVVLPLSLHFLTDWLGFLGSAAAFVVFLSFQSTAVIVYLAWRKPHDEQTWPGLKFWKEALEWEPMRLYLGLGVGGMLASSEWMYWETLSMMIGTLGVVDLSVHTVPTQVILVAFMVPLGTGVALSVRLGATLPRNVHRAKTLAAGCLGVGASVNLLTAVLMYTGRVRIFRFFTSEPEVLAGCEEIWFKVCLYYFNLSTFGINMGIAVGLGMQWTLGFVTVLFLWIIGLPAAYYFALIQGGGLSAAWSWIWPPYVAINAVLMLAFVTKDWEEIASMIRLREGIVGGELESLILQPHNDRYGATTTRINGDKV